MSRVYNFSAGPAVLPEEVLRQAAAEMLDYDGTGMSGYGDEPSLQALRAHHRDGRGRPARAAAAFPDNYQRAVSCRAAPPSSSPPSP